MRLFTPRMRTVGLALTLLGAGVVALATREANALARTAIERGATSALGLQTTLGRARVRWLAGEVVLTGLRVDPPPGFGREAFLTIGEGRARLSLRRALLSSDRVRVPSVRLDHVAIEIERGPRGASYDTILKRPRGKGHFLIDDLLLCDVTVRVRSADGTLTLRLPELRLHGVGSDEAGDAILAEAHDAVLETSASARPGAGPVLTIGQARARLSPGFVLRDLVVRGVTAEVPPDPAVAGAVSMTVRIPEICVAGDAPGAGADLVFTAEIRRVGVKSGAPPGFDAGPWVALREGRARVALAALWGDPVVVDAVRLDEISLEIQHGPKGTNYGTILEARSAAAIPSAGGPRFQVRDLIARDVTVRVREDLAVVAIPLTLRVPEVHLRDIGKETERGVILGQLHDIVIRAILEAILGTDVRTIPADFVRDFRAILADVGGTAAAAGKPAAEDTPASDLKRAGEHAGGLLQELGGDAVKTFKDAFDSGSK